MLEQINLVNIIGLTLAIISIVLALRSARKKLILYYIESRELSVENINKCEQKSKLKSSKLTESYLTFWNATNKTLSSKDFPSKEKLRIVFSSHMKVIHSEILSSNEKSNRITLKNNKRKNGISAIKLDFEYIDKRQGALIKIIHNGDNDIKLSGKIIGNGKLKQVFDNPFKFSINELYLINATLFLGTITFYQFWSHLTNSFLIGIAASSINVLMLIYIYYKHRTSISMDLRGLNK